MTEGTLVEWLVRPGQRVAAGELLYVLETEKITNEIEADRAGDIDELVVSAGETVEVGTLLATWRGEQAAPRAPNPNPARPAVGTIEPRSHPRAARVIASPHARQLARNHGIDLHQVTGSGPRGRIKAADVLHWRDEVPPPATVQAAPESGAQRIPLTGAQRTVATRMAQSSREIPHFYLEATANLGALLTLHRQIKARPNTPPLTLTHWIVQAVGLALAENPLSRRVWSEDAWLELADSDVALAAATPKGLYVAVAKQVATRNLLANAAQLEELTQRARAGRLSAAESAGGAICVSNLGGTRVKNVFPIILPGQSSILGVGRTEAVFRPDEHGAPTLCHELGLVLACDHRVFNGMDGAQLLDAVIGRLEDPFSLLL